MASPPSRDLESTSKSCASRASLFVSSDALRNASSSSAAGRAPRQRQIELGLQRAERRAQLMAGIVEQAALAVTRCLQPVKKRVQGLAKARDLVAGGGHRAAAWSDR